MDVYLQLSYQRGADRGVFLPHKNQPLREIGAVFPISVNIISSRTAERPCTDHNSNNN